MSNPKNVIKNRDYNDLVNKCVEAFIEIDASAYRARKIEDIKESHRIYKMIEQPTDFPWPGAFNTVLPFLTITIDNLAPRMHAGFVGKQPYVQFKPTGVTEPDEIDLFLESWFNAELNQAVKIENSVTKIVQTLLLEGTVYPVAEYNEDYITRDDFEFGEMEGGLVKVDEDGEPLTKEIEDKIFSGGKISFVPFTDIYIKDDAEDWEKEDIIRIVRPTYAELKLLEQEGEGYLNIDEELLKEEGFQTNQSPSQEVEGVEPNNEVIECYEFHCNYIYQKENEKKEDIKDWVAERVVALITKKSEILIRLILLKKINMLNQHLIKRIRLYPEVGEAYGDSVYDKMKAIQNGASDSYNLLMNVAYICMLPFFFYSNKAGLPEDMCLTPGAGIEVDNSQEIVFPKFNINPNSFIPIFNIWSKLWERLGSIGDLQTGLPSSQAGTATEVMLTLQEGNIKHNYQTKITREEFLALIRTIYDLYYKNMSFATTFFYHGDEVRVPRDKMRRAYKFRLTGSTELSNTVLELKKAEQLYGMLRQDPLTDPMKLLEDVVSKFNPDSDPKEYINPEINQVIEQYMQQKEMQAQQQAQQQQAQGGAPGQGPVGPGAGQGQVIPGQGQGQGSAGPGQPSSEGQI